MLQQENPDDYVISTGEAHTVKEFVDAAFSFVGLDWKQYVVVDKRFYRAAEVFELNDQGVAVRVQCHYQAATDSNALVA